MWPELTSTHGGEHYLAISRKNNPVRMFPKLWELFLKRVILSWQGQKIFLGQVVTQLWTKFCPDSLISENKLRKVRGGGLPTFCPKSERQQNPDKVDLFLSRNGHSLDS